MNKVDERREYTRYAAHHLAVFVRSMRDKEEKWIPGEITAVDINRHGMALETTHNFSTGDLLAMVIRNDDYSMAEVVGIVCNRSTSEKGFRFGIRFDFDESEQGQKISNELLMLEKQAADQIH
jgi:hypothetical protein